MDKKVITDAAFEAIITALYHTILNRRVDTAGLTHWTRRYRNGAMTLDQIARKFMESPEAQKTEDRTVDKNGKLLHIGAEVQLGEDKDSFHIVSGFKGEFIYLAPTPGNLYPNDGKFDGATKRVDPSWG